MAKHIKMIKNATGCPDFIHPVMYEEGKVYKVVERGLNDNKTPRKLAHVEGEVPDSIAAGFLSDTPTSPQSAIEVNEKGKEKSKAKASKDKDKEEEKSEATGQENKMA